MINPRIDSSAELALKTKKKTAVIKSRAKPKTATKPSDISSKPPAGKNSKHEKLLKLLRSKQGVIMPTLVKETGWQAHTVRAAISRLRTSGFDIKLSHNGKDHPVYRIVKEPKH